MSGEALKCILAAAEASEVGRAFSSEILLALFVFLRQYAKKKPAKGIKLARSAMECKPIDCKADCSDHQWRFSSPGHDQHLSLRDRKSRIIPRLLAANKARLSGDWGITLVPRAKMR